MPIKYIKGDIFIAQTDAIINTVNCVGVMGKGIALEFKRRWPKNFQAYKKLCAENKLITGKMFVFENSDMFKSDSHRYLINFPTKQHWRSKSKLSYIEEGLNDFIIQIKKFNIKSVAIPPLGCGNGGLDWLVVRDLIEKKLSPINDVEFLVFVPKEEKIEPEFQEIPHTSDFTQQRATLIKTLGDFQDYFGGYYTRLSIQKLTYFLQVLGIPFNLKFEKAEFGPYSEKLNIALKSLETKNFITGYTAIDSQTTVTHSAYAAADEYLMQYSRLKHEKIITDLSHLIEGYESPFGMELLSSTHYLFHTEAKTNPSTILEAFANWSDHKKNNFGENEIESAFHRLQTDGLIH